MAQIVAAALTAHAPLITGEPDIAQPEQRDRLHAGFRELHRRLAAARPDLLVMFVNDHLQNFAYDNLPSFCAGLAPSATARQHVMKDAFTDQELAGYELSEAERAALTSGDPGQLYQLGANPYLIRRVFRRRFAI